MPVVQLTIASARMIESVVESVISNNKVITMLIVLIIVIIILLLLVWMSDDKVDVRASHLSLLYLLLMSFVVNSNFYSITGMLFYIYFGTQNMACSN